MPGYQLANCDKYKIDKNYFCSFCELLLRDVMQTHCGHLYCFSCLGNLRHPVLPHVLVCPVHVEEQQLQENQVFADNFMRREVASVVVSCIFSSEDCPWKGEVRHLEAHTIGCGYQRVKCVHPECGKFVKRISLSYHVESECEFRLVACELCQSQVVFCKLQMHVSREHQAVYEEIGSCNDHSHEQPSNVPITERDGDDNMESSLTFDELVRRV